MADSAARRKSHAIASSQPPPKAIEFTAAIVTVRDCSIPRMNAWAESISSLPSLSGDILVNSLMSAPALNVNTFEDANTTTRSLPSISSHSSVSSFTTCGEIGLAGGRLSHTMPTSPRVSSAIVSRDWPSSGCG